MNFVHINNVAIEILGYPLSYVELIGTLFGLVSVIFASRSNILTWPTGIINELFLFLLFFQIQLYADMFLQVYFFIVTIYGWYSWKSSTRNFKVSYLNKSFRVYLISLVILGTFIAGYFFSNIHIYLPDYFKNPAAYPFCDSFVLIASMVATILLAKKKIETWFLWMTIDVVCVFIYCNKQIYFLSLEYIIFLGLAIYGLFNWRRLSSND